MASRDIGGSIQAALQDLFAEKAVVEDAIHKLQSLLGDMAQTVTGPRGKPSRRKAKATGPRRKAAKRVAKKGTDHGSKKAATKKATKRKAKKKASAKDDATANWTGAARKAAAERMRKYWAERKKRGASGRPKKKT